MRKAATADAQQKLNNEIAAKKKTFDRDAEDMNNEVEQADGKLMDEISNKMAVVIDEFAKKNGYTVVMDAAAPVLWASEASNVTPEVIKLYDQRHPVAGASGSARLRLLLRRRRSRDRTPGRERTRLESHAHPIGAARVSKRWLAATRPMHSWARRRARNQVSRNSCNTSFDNSTPRSVSRSTAPSVSSSPASRKR